jgi:hypothetical protein
MALWVLGAMVSKSDRTSHTATMLVGYRRCETEDEARGSFLRWVETEKPGFSLEDMLCLRVPS